MRIHRAGEGAPFTGLKPAGLDLGPAVPAADRALEEGSAEKVVRLLVDAVRAGVHAHFRAAVESGFSIQTMWPRDAGMSKPTCRTCIYVERLWEAATGPVHGDHAEHASQVHSAEHAMHHH